MKMAGKCKNLSKVSEEIAKLVIYQVFVSLKWVKSCKKKGSHFGKITEKLSDFKALLTLMSFKIDGKVSKTAFKTLKIEK